MSDRTITPVRTSKTQDGYRFDLFSVDSLLYYVVFKGRLCMVRVVKGTTVEYPNLIFEDYAQAVKACEAMNRIFQTGDFDIRCVFR